MGEVVLPLLCRELKSKQKYLELLDKDTRFLEPTVANIKEEIAEIEKAIAAIEKSVSEART